MRFVCSAIAARFDVVQTADFLGRKLASRLKETNGDSNAESAGSAAAGREGGDEEEGDEELLGRERRKEGADPLDLEVIDDRDLYQHLLKVQYLIFLSTIVETQGYSGVVPGLSKFESPRLIVVDWVGGFLRHGRLL